MRRPDSSGSVLVPLRSWAPTGGSVTAGWTEISAVCTAPEARGGGHAARPVRTLMDRISARGERAFLHVVPAIPVQFVSTRIRGSGPVMR
ncbi:GNAT family N-acetyltransferase [Rhodococcus sp. ZPP]|uniref:GNAT family N-acetyltransferase n=1 Tax=Rhodococcus sp. ZPP TaxID=2749906 RepID=UPI003298296D